ncbi:MAG TPA: folylpolyglutamate synthase/dihydrofolate synthase family protein [Anaerolineales bacterium]|jgi:dihydrofolate synthase/folylpolyglutamate synthase|nr:folylpolyglutamate synthase/dihydrofolate synthase family protein [Anaerolineales bacterium]
MNVEERYQQTLDYLYSYIDYSLVRNLRYSPEKFDLTRMYAFMEALGNPQEDYPIIHIAGTKGKGSVSSLCASTLQAAGYQVGLYTSPHLIDFNERMRVNGTVISHADLVDLVEEYKSVIEDIPHLTTFEITTGLAFLYFRIRGVNAAVIEVGLGGRLDPTNVVVPIVSVITSISYDHTQILGETLAEIATEKAGIIKSAVPVVVAPQKDEALSAIRRIAEKRASPLIQMGKDYLFSPLSRSLEGQSLLVWSATEQEQVNAYIESGGVQEWEPTRINIPLLGYHQVENAATAYTALQIARKSSLVMSDAAIRQGFGEVFWPGRFEILQRYPPVILDSAHNRDSALKLRLALDDYFPGYPVVLIFGASEDKDIDGMFSELLPRVRQVIATRSFHPRAMEPEKLVELAHQFGRPARLVPDVEDALEEALRLAEGEAVVLITGSIFVVAGVRQAWFVSQTSPTLPG